MARRYFPVAVTALGFAWACAPAEAPITEQVQLNLEIDNGTSLNGATFHAQPVTHIDVFAYDQFHQPIGAFPTWIPPTFNPYGGVGPNGDSFGSIQLDELAGLSFESGLRVEELVGAELDAETQRGEDTLLKVTGVAAGTGAYSDLLYYSVYAADGADWTPLCGNGADGQPIPALAVPGEWDHGRGTRTGGQWSNDGRSFSFACRGSSIAKCMEAGYKPWIDPESRAEQELDLLSSREADRPNHLQACVRMMRADYCGDGTSHTVNGRRIEFWDSMELHQRENPTWKMEAVWSPRGAVCSISTRVDHAMGSSARCLNDLYYRAASDRDPCIDGVHLDSLERERGYIANSYERRLIIDPRYDW